MRTFLYATKLVMEEMEQKTRKKKLKMQMHAADEVYGIFLAFHFVVNSFID